MGPPAEGAATDAAGVPGESVLEEIRRQRGEGGGRRAWLLRSLGLVVLGLAILLIRRNVSWDDTLQLEAGTSTAVLQGSLDGSWREAQARFSLEDVERAAVALNALLGAGGSPGSELEEALAAGPTLVASRFELGLADGRVLARVAAGAGAEADGAAGTASVDRIDWRPGMRRTLSEIRPLGLLTALGFLMLASLCVATRWWRLLHLNGCATTWWNAFRYTYSGLFFNAVVPGINGGDVARAVAVVREHPDRRGDAFMTVVVDRVLGLVGMVLIGTGLVLAGDGRLDSLKLPVGLFCAAVLVGAGLFFSAVVRRIVRFEQLVGALPQGERLLRLDAGARRLLGRPGEVGIALALSFGNHALNGLAVFTAAAALGTALGVQDWVTVMAISNTLAAVPISPGGLGVGEVMFGSLAELLGSTYAIGVSTSLLYRLCLYGMSLLGGLVMLLPGSRPRG